MAIDFDLCRRVGRAARDAAGRFAHLLDGSYMDPEAQDEYVGLVMTTMLGHRPRPWAWDHTDAARSPMLEPAR